MNFLSLIRAFCLAVIISSAQVSSALAHQHLPKSDLESTLAGLGWDLKTAEIKTEKVSDGLYVLFGLGGNIAVSVGADGVLIVDDQFPQLMQKIKAAIAELNGDKITYAINTHWHFDHAEGNNALGPEGTTIVAHENAREDMSQGGLIDMVRYQYLQQPYPELALPELTYSHEMTIHFNEGSIELKRFAPAHTDGDTAVFFKKHNAVHLGDVFNNTGYPFIDVGSGGDVDGLIRFCEETLLSINEDTVVIPGHGPVTNYKALEQYVAMVRTVRDRIQQLIDDGQTFEEIMQSNPTADFDPIYGPETASLGFIDRIYYDLTQQK